MAEGKGSFPFIKAEEGGGRLFSAGAGWGWVLETTHTRQERKALSPDKNYYFKMF